MRDRAKVCYGRPRRPLEGPERKVVATIHFDMLPTPRLLSPLRKKKGHQNQFATLTKSVTRLTVKPISIASKTRESDPAIISSPL